MNRTDLEKHIAELYGAAAEFLWDSDPSYAVYRHQNNRKWFAIIMEIPRSKLGLEGEGGINVVNLKSDPLLIGSLLRDDGIHPAYHMNKTHWITLRLDSSVPADKVKWLLDLSFTLTSKSKKRR